MYRTINKTTYTNLIKTHLDGHGTPRMECRMWQSNRAILQIYETILPKGDQEKGADLNNFVNEWSL